MLIVSWHYLTSQSQKVFNSILHFPWTFSWHWFYFMFIDEKEVRNRIWNGVKGNRECYFAIIGKYWEEMKNLKRLIKNDVASTSTVNHALWSKSGKKWSVFYAVCANIVSIPMRREMFCQWKDFLFRCESDCRWAYVHTNTNSDGHCTHCLSNSRSISIHIPSNCSLTLTAERHWNGWLSQNKYALRRNTATARTAWRSPTAMEPTVRREGIGRGEKKERKKEQEKILIN